MSKLFEGRTAWPLPHCLKTVQRADDILILEDGVRCRSMALARRALARDPASCSLQPAANWAGGGAA